MHDHFDQSCGGNLDFLEVQLIFLPRFGCIKFIFLLLVEMEEDILLDDFILKLKSSLSHL